MTCAQECFCKVHLAERICTCMCWVVPIHLQIYFWEVVTKQESDLIFYSKEENQFLHPSVWQDVILISVPFATFRLFNFSKRRQENIVWEESWQNPWCTHGKGIIIWRGFWHSSDTIPFQHPLRTGRWETRWTEVEEEGNQCEDWVTKKTLCHACANRISNDSWCSGHRKWT